MTGLSLLRERTSQQVMAQGWEAANQDGLLSKGALDMTRPRGTPAHVLGSSGG